MLSSDSVHRSFSLSTKELEMDAYGDQLSLYKLKSKRVDGSKLCNRAFTVTQIDLSGSICEIKVPVWFPPSQRSGKTFL